MDMEPVDSTCIKEMGYDIRSKRLGIIFVENERHYEYIDVPHDVYMLLKSAPSKGTFYNEEIKGKYLYEEL